MRLNGPVMRDSCRIENNLLVIPFDPMPWRSQAACRGMDTNLFFPRRGEPAEPACRVCDDCPVRQPCLEFAMTNYESHGVWGGLSERGRRQIRHAQLRGIPTVKMTGDSNE